MDESVRVSKFVGLCDPFRWRATHPFRFCFVFLPLPVEVEELLSSTRVF